MTSSPPSSSDANAQPTSSAFGLLHEKVQRWAWEQGWMEMRDIQEASVAPILQGSTDVILAGISGLVHDRVRQEMFAVYSATDIPAFLDARVRELLAEGRAHFARYGLAECPLLAHGRETLLFGWRGDRVMDTLLVQLCARGLKVMRDGLALAVDGISPGGLAKHLRALVEAGPADAFALAATVANKRERKHDRFLAEELLSMDYTTRSLDPQGAWQTLHRILTRL